VSAVDARVLRRAPSARPYVAALVLTGIAGAGLLVTQAALLAYGIATVSIAVCAPLAFVIAGRALLAWITDLLQHRAATAVTASLRRTVMRHALRLGPPWLAGVRSGEITALVTTGVDGLDAYVARYLPQLVLAMIVPVIVLVTMARADLIATLTVVATLPLIPVFMALVGATTRAAAQRRMVTLGRLSHHFLDVVSGLTTLKSFGRAAAQTERVRAVGDDYRIATMRTLRLAFLSTLVLDVLSTIAVALVAVGVGLRLVDGRLDLRTALFVLILAPEAYAPMRALGAAFHASADGVAAMDEVERVLAVPAPDSNRAPDSTRLPDSAAARPRGLDVWRDVTLVVDAVSVRHPGRHESTPHEVSLVARPGEFVALTGDNGAGKSTLLSVVLGFHGDGSGSGSGTSTDSANVGDVDAGAIAGTVRLIGAAGETRRLGEVDGRAWRAHFAWVPQQPYLFAGTVADNIALGSRDAATVAREALVAAAEIAALDVDLDTEIADDGGGLSAGQRRRVAIARALFRDAPILLLDEPTAGLDEDTERELLARLRADGRTVVAVAHRPATIAAADRVVPVASAAAPVVDSTTPADASTMAVR
jgi:ATP-binding cassette, subfamily C, bacterial CydD